MSISQNLCLRGVFFLLENLVFRLCNQQCILSCAQRKKALKRNKEKYGFLQNKSENYLQLRHNRTFINFLFLVWFISNFSQSTIWIGLPFKPQRRMYDLKWRHTSFVLNIPYIVFIYEQVNWQHTWITCLPGTVVYVWFLIDNCSIFYFGNVLITDVWLRAA